MKASAPPPRPVFIRMFERAARLILALYPADYRELLGSDMLETFGRECQRTLDNKRHVRLMVYALRTLAGFVIGATRGRIERAVTHVAESVKRPSIRIERLVQETRYAARRLMRSPGFTIAAIVTLGLAIGGSASMFTLVNRILIQPLPYPNAGRLISLSHTAPGLDMVEGGQSWATFHHYREHAHTLERIALHQPAFVNLTGGGPPTRVSLAMITPSLFSVLGTRPLIGRVLDAVDADPGSQPVVLISERLWRSRYGADSAVVGGTVEINDRAREVVGVIASGFDFPTPDTDVWMNMAHERPGALDAFYPSGVGMIAAGYSIEDVRVELNALVNDLTAARASSSVPFQQWRLAAVVEPLKSSIVGDATALLWILFGAVGVVVLVAAVNITTLFLVRAADRHRELVIRRALGALGRDVRHFFLSESLLLSAGAGVLGAGVAWTALRFATQWGAGMLPRLHEVHADSWMLGFTLVLTMAIGVAVAAVTTRRGRTTASWGLLIRQRGDTRSDRQAHRVLVVFQVAMAFALLVGAGLLLRSFANLRKIDLGFDERNVLTFDITLPSGRYQTYDRAAGFFRDLLARVGAVPGVTAAGAVSDLPLSPRSWTRMTDHLEVASRRDGGGDPVTVNLALVTPGYFDALRIPILDGGAVSEAASTFSQPVYVSESLARRVFGEQSAVGERVRRAGNSARPWNTVAGVIGPVHAHAVHQPPTDILYIPVLDAPPDSGFVPAAMTVAVRTAGMPTSIVPMMRSLVAALDSELSISNVGLLSDTVARATARWSLASTLLTIAAGTALLLGTVGLYAVMSFTVARRLHEIGIRMAVGAREGTIRWMIVRQAGAMVVLGLSAGFVAAAAGTRLLRDLLYELTPNDPSTFALTATVILIAAAVAGDIPARRAASVDPMRVLKGD